MGVFYPFWCHNTLSLKQIIGFEINRNTFLPYYWCTIFTVTKNCAWKYKINYTMHFWYHILRKDSHKVIIQELNMTLYRYFIRINLQIQILYQNIVFEERFVFWSVLYIFKKSFLYIFGSVRSSTSPNVHPSGPCLSWALNIYLSGSSDFQAALSYLSISSLPELWAYFIGVGQTKPKILHLVDGLIV